MGDPLDNPCNTTVKEEPVDEQLLDNLEGLQGKLKYISTQMDDLVKEPLDGPLDSEMDVLVKEESSVNRSISGNKQRVYFIGDSQINILVKTNLFREYDVVNWAFPGKRTDEILEEVRNKIQERTKRGVRVEENAIVVIWVGTNDVLQGKCEPFIIYFRKSMKLFRRLFRRILLVTLPPILKPPHKTPCKESVIRMNKCIASFNNSNKKVNIRSINPSQICLKLDGSVRLELYEQKIGNKFTRDDQIQLNLMAFKIIASKIKEIFCLL
uniref:Uncharacterized protein n=1 Tax=Cacopsylla melanoneura TaxID=428564 RepID=A0A8D9A2M4_9HEMI